MPKSLIILIQKACFLTIVCILLCGQSDAQLCVIINNDNPTDTLSKSELRRIYLGEETHWHFQKRNEPIILTDYKGKMNIAGEYYPQVVGLSPVKVRMKWLEKIFNGEFQSLASPFESEKEVIEFIAANRSAIGFVHLDQITPKPAAIKILKIDGAPYLTSQ
jgi:ABC-type phosphate transport system substrate-binding protein